jgi:hypothetical protein
LRRGGGGRDTPGQRGSHNLARPELLPFRDAARLARAALAGGIRRVDGWRFELTQLACRAITDDYRKARPGATRWCLEIATGDYGAAGDDAAIKRAPRAARRLP